MKEHQRLARLRQTFAVKNIDAILVSQPENRRYLAGFDGSAGFLLINQQRAILATDFRYVEQAKKQAPGYEIVRISGEIQEWLSPLLASLRLKRLGFEAESLFFATYQRMSEMVDNAEFQLGLVPTEGLVESVRAVKEPEEVALITQAAVLADSALKHIEDVIQPGMSEKEVAWELEKFLRHNGSESLPFEIIVASGANSALPHHKPSPRTINAGEPVLIDLGARVEGYACDLTRTFCLGIPGELYSRVYNVVLSAQQAATSGIRKGMTGGEADSLARQVIEKAGYGEAFGHSLGHGVGLATHEKPLVGRLSQEKLDNGMVFTIEPGIYLPEWGGVRIEDTVILENGAVRVLSTAHK